MSTGMGTNSLGLSLLLSWGHMEHYHSFGLMLKTKALFTHLKFSKLTELCRTGYFHLFSNIHTHFQLAETLT